MKLASLTNVLITGAIALGATATINQPSQAESRPSHSLAEYNTAEEIVFVMGISLGKLRFLTTSRHTSPITHHLCFKISKKTGGERIISAQKPNLKAAQSFSCARFELG
ncbi:hypothetical protein [Nostoc sp.]|uniref:hypothetical protein n=1 Tax=Nostoc sp. TaxID=1180 RepID=UPI002FF5C2EA